MKKILSYVSKDGKNFTVKLDGYDTCFIECENFIDEIPAWNDPIIDIVYLLIGVPIKKITYINPNFDLEPEYLDIAFDLLAEKGTEKDIDSFIKTLIKVAAECDAENIVDYLENEYGYVL